LPRCRNDHAIIFIVNSGRPKSAHSDVVHLLERFRGVSCPLFRSRSNRFKRGINCPTDCDTRRAGARARACCLIVSLSKVRTGVLSLHATGRSTTTARDNINPLDMTSHVRFRNGCVSLIERNRIEREQRWLAREMLR
jgi:hypothetical protein